MTLTPLRLGTSLFLTQHWFTPEDVAILEASPVSCVEVAPPAMFGASPAEVDASLDALRRSRLEIWSVHSPFGSDLDLSSPDEQVRTHSCDAVARAFALAHDLGCKAVVVHPSTEPIAPGERAARLAISRRSLASMVEVARQSGVPAALEPLPRTCLGNTADEVVALLEGLPPEWIGICLDVNHANVGQDLVAVIHRLGGRIRTTHISDNDGVDEKHWLPGEGVIPWPAVISALRDVGYGGPLMYEVNLGNFPLAERLRHFGENWEELVGGA